MLHVYEQNKMMMMMMMMCMCIAWKGCPRNDLYCIGGTLNPTHSFTAQTFTKMITAMYCKIHRFIYHFRHISKRQQKNI